jgi:hypothetical protein
MLAAMRGELAKAPKKDRWKFEIAGVIGSVLLLAAGIGAVLVAGGNATLPVIAARAGVLAMCGLVCAFSAGVAIAPGARRAQLLSIGAFVVASVVLVLVRREVGPGTAPEWACTVTHLGVGAVPLAIGLFALRRSGLKLVAGLALGVAAGTTGAMVGELACGRDSTHVLLFHVTAWLAMVAAGALLSRVVAPRSHAP